MSGWRRERTGFNDYCDECGYAFHGEGCALWHDGRGELACSRGCATKLDARHKALPFRCAVCGYHYHSTTAAADCARDDAKLGEGSR